MQIIVGSLVDTGPNSLLLERQSTAMTVDQEMGGWMQRLSMLRSIPGSFRSLARLAKRRSGCLQQGFTISNGATHFPEARSLRIPNLSVTLHLEVE